MHNDAHHDESNGRNDVIRAPEEEFRMLIGRERTIGKHKVTYDDTTHVDYLEGSCILMKTYVIGELGLLDSVFFTYWEDLDWCMR